MQCLNAARLKYKPHDERKKNIMRVWTTALCWSLHSHEPNYRYNWSYLQTVGTKCMEIRLIFIQARCERPLKLRASDTHQISARSRNKVCFMKSYLLLNILHFIYCVSGSPWCYANGQRRFGNFHSANVFPHTFLKLHVGVLPVF